ncbi:hypothetical protein T4E_666 [Trichinella pseudospiralis]|uniref:Uncharacterized protein n=1 Tax=Trichinella pseudospiralis TaxID=6337 RepID=A0A0V0XQJ5_TRIPS|nr:hypothetical protein T4E_666 [Trichinella pseudospiralis]
MKTGKSENVDGTWSNTYTPKMDNFAYKSNDVRVYQLCKSASSQNEQQIIVVYKYTEMISSESEFYFLKDIGENASSFFDLWVDDVHVSGSRREKAEALRKTLLFAFLRCVGSYYYHGC